MTFKEKMFSSKQVELIAAAGLIPFNVYLEVQGVMPNAIDDLNTEDPAVQSQIISAAILCFQGVDPEDVLKMLFRKPLIQQSVPVDQARCATIVFYNAVRSILRVTFEDPTMCWEGFRVFCKVAFSNTKVRIEQEPSESELS